MRAETKSRTGGDTLNDNDDDDQSRVTRPTGTATVFPQGTRLLPVLTSASLSKKGIYVLRSALLGSSPAARYFTMD